MRRFFKRILFCLNMSMIIVLCFGQNSKTVVVFKTHFDIGYTHLASEAIEMYRTSMIDNALNAIDEMPESQQFSWTISGWPLYQMLWDGQKPERRKRIEDAINKGKICWHSLPVTTETESVDMETLVRGFRFSNELSRKYGKPLSISAKMSDVPQHSWFIPTLLANAGIKFFHIGTNNQCIPPHVPDLFFWEGLDGSRVLVFISKQSYGSDLFPPENWPFKTWMALQMTGDNAGPPTSQKVKDLINTLHEKSPETQLILGTMDDFYSELSKEDLSKVPIVKGDMPDTWIQGIGSMPNEMGLAMQVRPQICGWESLSTNLSAYGFQPNENKDKIAEAYENSLMFGEHTWGSQTEGIPDNFWGDTLLTAISEYKRKKANGVQILSIKPGLAYFEESFDQHRRYIWKVRDLVSEGMSNNMEFLAENVKGKGKRVIVYNPLPWSRDAIVDINGYSFMAKQLPPNGYKTFKLPCKKEAQKIEINNLIENRYFKIVLSPEKGGISSIIDKKTGRELVEPGSLMGQYLFEQFSAAEVFNFIGEYDKNNHPWSGTGRERGVYHGAPITDESIANSGQQLGKPHMPKDVQYSANYASKGKIENIKKNEVGLIVSMSYPALGNNPDTTKLRVFLYDEQPYIDFEWEIQNKTPNRIPEGGWLCFPLNLKNPSWKLGRLGSIVDPQKDIIKDNNFELFCLQSGVEARGEDGYGIALCPMNSPLISLGKPGLWRFSHTWSEREPKIFVNLFNNMWNTNFPLWIDGSWKSRVRLWTLTPKSSNWDLIGRSLEALTNCPTVVTEKVGGNLPQKQAGIHILRKGVVLTAFGNNPDGDGILLRVWEQIGDSGECTVELPKCSTYKKAIPVDLRGTKLGEPISIINQRLSFKLNRYSPRSFVLVN